MHNDDRSYFHKYWTGCFDLTGEGKKVSDVLGDARTLEVMYLWWEEPPLSWEQLLSSLALSS